MKKIITSIVWLAIISLSSNAQEPVKGASSGANKFEWTSVHNANNIFSWAFATGINLKNGSTSTSISTMQNQEYGIESDQLILAGGQPHLKLMEDVENNRDHKGIPVCNCKAPGYGCYGNNSTYCSICRFKCTHPNIHF